MNFLTAGLILSLLAPMACTKQMNARESEKVSEKKPARTPQVTVTATFHTVGDLPRCDAGTEQMSAYISQRDVFVKCRSSFWRDVRPGDTSNNYVASSPIRFHEWVDSATKLRWIVPAKAEQPLASVKAGICGQGSKLPTREELAQASGNGLFEGLKAHGGVAFDSAWTANLDALGGISEGSLASVLPDGTKASENQTAGVYCVASLN